MTTPARRLPDFISAFEDFAATYNAPKLYFKAGAIWMLGTAVRRAVAMQARGNVTYCNLFMQMIGGPGTGKSQTVNAIKRILLPATKTSLIPASVTRAGLEDYMQKNLNMDGKTPDGQMLMSNECIGLSEEMQGILPDQDLGHLTLYNILYDNPSVHMAVTRSNGELRLEDPYCSIFTGAQPAFLATSMNEQAWGMGFMSRSIMVFGTPAERKSAFVHSTVDMKLMADLIHDLGIISKLYGWMSWTKDAIALYDEWWVKHGGIPIPTSKRLGMGYNSRRELHFFKYAMIMSIARSNDLMVTVDDVARGIQVQLEIEAQMKHIFTEMSQTGSMVAIQDILDVVRAASAAGNLVPEADLISMLMQRVPSTQVHATVDNLISSKAIEVGGGLDAKGFRKFKIGNSAGMI